MPCLDVKMITFFPRNIHWSSLFARKATVNTERVPLGHPIILHKSKKLNMAAVLVKRSIDWSWTNWSWTVIYRYRNDSDYLLQLCCCQYVILIHWNLHEMKVLLYWAVNLWPPISHHWQKKIPEIVDCVVPENIQTPTTEGIGNSRGMGGSEVQEIPEGRGVGP